MKLIIDGVIFENNAFGGIKRIFSNVLPLMCDLDPKLRVVLFFKKTPQSFLPIHPQISYVHFEKMPDYLHPWHLWQPHYEKIRNHYMKLRFGNDPTSIWLSTYFTRPFTKWHGKEVVFVYDLIYEMYPELLPGSERVIRKKNQAILSADKVFCISATTARDLQKFYPVTDSRIVVTHLSHDQIFSIRKSKNQSTATEKFILYVGRRGFYKGFNLLLNAYSKWDKNREIKLFVVGPSWSPEEKSLLLSLGVEGAVSLFENIDDEQLCDLYNQAEAFIYPSEYEGFGIPLLEAMACGCPVIASNIPSTQEVAGEVPIYFEPGNTNSLERALDLLSNNAEIQTRVSKGIAVAGGFSWKNTASQIYRALKALYE